MPKMMAKIAKSLRNMIGLQVTQWQVHGAMPPCTNVKVRSKVHKNAQKLSISKNKIPKFSSEGAAL